MPLWLDIWIEKNIVFTFEGLCCSIMISFFMIIPEEGCQIAFNSLTETNKTNISLVPASQSLLTDMAASEPCVCRLLSALTSIRPLTEHTPVCVMVIIRHFNSPVHIPVHCYTYQSLKLYYDVCDLTFPVRVFHARYNHILLLQDQFGLITQSSRVCNNGWEHCIFSSI